MYLHKEPVKVTCKVVNSGSGPSILKVSEYLVHFQYIAVCA